MISLGNSTVNTQKTRNHSIFPVFLGIKVYLDPIFRDKREVFRAEVIKKWKSILSKNQWSFTVRKSSFFLLSLDLLLKMNETELSVNPQHSWSDPLSSFLILIFPFKSWKSELYSTPYSFCFTVIERKKGIKELRQWSSYAKRGNAYI